MSEAGRALERRDAERAHFFRQARQRLRDAVLHLHLGAVDVRAVSKVTVRSSVPSHRRLRGHVQHVLDADDLLLERRGDGLRDDLGFAPG